MKTTITTVLALVAVSAFASGPTETKFEKELNANAPKLLFTTQPPPTFQYRRYSQYGNTIFGTSGLIAVPSAFTQGERQLAIGGFVSEDLSGGFVNFGLIPDLEVSASIFDHPGNNDHGIISAKFHLVPDQTNRFHVGFGVIDAADQDFQSFYAVVSSSITPPDVARENNAVGLNLHFGIGTGYFDGHLFGGAEVFFAEGFNLIGEWDGNDFNAGLRYQLNPNFLAEGGFYSTNPYFKLTYAMQF